MKIAINAGHCPGLDPGACGRYSEEADIVRRISEDLCYKLESVGYESLFIQEDEISDICGAANDFDADIFVSIHCNASDNPSACGTECFYWEPWDDSYTLAETIQDSLIDLLDTEDRGLKSGKDYYGPGKHLGVLNGTQMEATVLVELAFISNPSEEDLLNANIYHISTTLRDAICKFINER